ncbi:MAG: hypothetical protein NTX54_04560 [Chloroflexi bacterium]|nr:hypothetical protein [Chloroflexota bacterium]
MVGFGVVGTLAVVGTSGSCGPDPDPSKTGEPAVTAVDVRLDRGIPGTWEIVAGGVGPAPGQFNGPAGIAIGADGSILVAEHGNHRVQRLSASGLPVAEWGRKGSGPAEFVNPYGIAIGADGRIFVADRGNNRVQLGNVYVGEYGNNRVQKLAASGDPVASWGATGGRGGAGPGEFNWPVGFAIEPSGSLVIADWGNDRIQRISAAGAPMSQWGRKGTLAGEFGNPNGVAIDPSGRIWVTEYSNCRVQVLSPEGRPLAQFSATGMRPGKGVGEFTYPRGIAIDAGGAVFVTEFGNNRIQRFTPARV